MRDIAAETSQLTAELIECNRRDYGQVRRMLDRIAELVDIHVNATTNKYLYEDDFGGPAQPDPFNETIGETGLQLLQRHCTPWLVSVLNRPPAVPATTHGSDAGDGDEAPTEEDLVDDISAVMSQLCGRAATGACSTVWNLQHTGSYSLQETTYTEAEIGFQTWGGGVMLAKMIDQKVIDVTGQNVLELGSGTGLAGLVSARAGSRLTVLTDYHPTVLNNAQLNVECNNVERTAHVAKLDWFWVLSPEELEQETGMRFSHGGDHETDEQQREYALEDRNEDPVLTSSDFRIIIAADCIFDRMHSKLVPKVAKRYLSKHPDARFYVLLPHREKFKAELKAFEENMPAEGWELVFSQWIEKSTINFRYYIWRLPQ